MRIPVAVTDVLPATKGAKRRRRSHHARIGRGQPTGISLRVHASHDTRPVKAK